MKMKNWKAVLATGLVTIMAAGLAVSAWAAPVSLNGKYLGGYQEAYARDQAKQAAEEGIILLDNRNDVLPWTAEETKKVAVFGLGAANTLEARNSSLRPGEGTNIISALEDSGYEVTTQQWQEDYLDGYDGGSDSQGGDWQNMTAAKLTDGPIEEEHLNEATEADTAIYVIARDSTEGADRAASKGDYYLSDVEAENIRLMSESFQTCIIIMNSVGVIDTTFYEELEGLDALIMMGLAGVEGGAALVEILEGSVNPSGKTTYTWAYEHTQYSWAECYGNEYEVVYEEGVYVGYRYFDTFNVDPAYEFGFGLSYTDFEIEPLTVTADGDQVSVRVKVTNTGGTYAGKEVVQVYYTAPDGITEKPYQELAAYGKTEELKPGESQVLTISYNTTEMASYDEEQAAYIMDAGEYVIRVGSSSRNTQIAAVIDLDKTKTTEQLSNQLEATKEFNELSKFDENGQAVKSYTYPSEQQEYNAAPKISLSASTITTIDNASEYDESVTTYRTETLLDAEKAEDEYYTSGITSAATGAAGDNGGLRDTSGNLRTGGYIHWDADLTLMENMIQYYYNPNFRQYVAASTRTPAITDKTGANGYNDGQGYAEEIVTVKELDAGTSLLDVYNGTVSIEEFVGNMTAEQLTALVNGPGENNYWEWGLTVYRRNGQRAYDTTGVFYDVEDDHDNYENNFSRAEFNLAEKLKAAFYSSTKYENGRSAENWNTEEWNSLGIPTINMADGPGQVLNGRKEYTGDDITEDSNGYEVTAAMPSSPVMASTWNLELIYECGTCNGYDLANMDVTIWLAPGVNLIRSTLCGRNPEYYSEDPLVTGLSTAETILGVQSVPGVGAMMKHYALNNQEDGRAFVNTIASERTKRELYLKGFEIAVKASQPMSIMTSYNVLEGYYTAASYELNIGILRGEWDYQGFVCSDWTTAAAAADTAHSGNDLFQPGSRYSEMLDTVTWTEPEFLENGEIKVTSEMAYGPHSTYVSQWGDFVPETLEDPADLSQDLKEEGWEAVSYVPTHWSNSSQIASDVNDLNENGENTGSAEYAIIHYVAKTDQNGNITEYKGTYKNNDRIYIGDLQSSAINILNVVIKSQNMADLYGDQVEIKPYSEYFDLKDYVTVERNDSPDPIDPPDTNDPKDTDDPTNPSQTDDPKDTDDPTNPSQTDEPKDTDDPTTPSQTDDPKDTDNPTNPSQTDDPKNTDDPTNPSQTNKSSGGKSGSATGKTSVQTGDTNKIIPIIILSVAALGIVVFFNIKKIRK